MEELATATTELSEQQFATLVDALGASADGVDGLIALLREDHAVYDQRGTAAIVRMRGWILLALARVGLPERALLFVLEELDAGHDAYLVAAAARALRSSPSPRSEFAPFVMRALGNMRYRDETVAFDAYGAYAISSADTTAVRELLATLVWLGPYGRDVLPQLEALRAPGSGISRKLQDHLERAIDAMERAPSSAPAVSDACCAWPIRLGSVLTWLPSAHPAIDAIRSTVFEDQNGARITYGEYFSGQPSVVAFFYTRCDNPQKCSLTVSKLARVQQQLADRGVADRVRTAAITYDPGFDQPVRLRAYAQNRQMRMDDGHRLLRTTDGIEPLRRYFELGVNFVDSLVNRHRIEIYALDEAGRIAASFGRIHWDEREVVDRVMALLNDRSEKTSQPTAVTVSSSSADRDDSGPRSTTSVSRSASATSPILATIAALGVALFPKCPVCWAAYMSMLGIASLERIPYSPWMQPLLVTVLLINIAAVRWRARSTGRMSGFYLVSAGAVAILAAKLSAGAGQMAIYGVMLTAAGSALSAARARSPRLA